MFMLQIQSLSVGYGPKLVLHSITLNLQAGEILALIGPNGAGKTTLIRAVSGVIQPRSGSLRAGSENLAGMSIAQRARKLAVVPQARNLPEPYTVWQTVLLGRTPYLGWLGQPAERDRARVRWALERTETLDLAQRCIGELSGGEQQRVLLARALAQETPILLLDEPTAHLDLHHQTVLLDLVYALTRENHLAVLMALHDLNLAALYADRVALLVDGSLQAVGTPAEVLTAERLSQAYRLPLHVIPHPDFGVPLVLPEGMQKKMGVKPGDEL
jgi:iron complex transport system ATP-binding protein